MASDEEPIYCLCRLPYDETRFMIECDVCKDWFHGGCVGVQEHQAVDIEIYHCPNCSRKHGPLVLKKRKNWHRHDYSEEDGNVSSAVQTGTIVFIKDLKKRSFPPADAIPIRRVHGAQLTPHYFDEEGFDVPMLCEKKDGLGLMLPPPSFTIRDVEELVGPMREIDVIDVARQEDIKMIMREWTEYYNSTNRDKVLNVISLEFSDTRMSELVTPPHIIRQISWARTVWPEQLPEDSSLSRPEVQKYCLMGVKDSFTDFHIDFGGTSVWYHILRGEKVFYFVRPTEKNLKRYEHWLSSSQQSETFFGDLVDKCYRQVVKQGQTLFIPTGWIHAVLTPIDSLVFGGNFLHNYNIPLQLQCYDIERQVKTPDKFMFPSYETINWYAAKYLLDMLKDFTEEKKSVPMYLAEGARSLTASLKGWTQRKDYAKVGKQDVADYIQYGKLLKELTKEIKVLDALNPSPSTKGNKKKKAEKKSISHPKKAVSLDLLEEHTKETLKATEKKQRDESIYNFEDEEDEPPLSLKVRIPKAGAYQPDKVDDDSGIGKEKENKDVKGNKDLKRGRGLKNQSSSAKKAILEVKEDVVKLKTEESSDSASPVKEIPQCLKFKLSNGKMVSTDRKSKPKKFRKKEFLLLGEDIVKDEPSMKAEEIDAETKISLNKKEETKPSIKETTEKKSPSKQNKKFPVASKDKKSPISKKKKSVDSTEIISRQKTLSSKGEKKKSSSVGVSQNKNVSKGNREKDNSDSEADNLVVDENPKKKSKNQKTTSTTKPASLKMRPPQDASSVAEGDQSDSEISNRLGLDTIRGGLNGSISDILTASGYGTETSFKVDGDGSGMRDAIAGMLTMSQMVEGGKGEGSLFTPKGGEADSGFHSQMSATDEEKHLMSDCYQDEEFVYPSFELSDDEGNESMTKKQVKDDNWNPKARVNSNTVKAERDHREGVQKKSMAENLATTAAKLAEKPLDKKQLKKSPKVKSPEVKEFEVQPLPGPSSSLDDEPVNAFRPGIKRPVDPCANKDPLSLSNKAKKPRKGLATAKQRLGKLLKIKKMVF